MTTLQQFNQPVTSLPPKPPQKLSKISLKTPEKLYILGAIAGTIGTAISQQAALTSIPILALLLIQRTNQQRHTLTQQQQQQQQQITAIVEHSLKSLPTQIQQLKTQLEELESFSNNSLTKTKLVLIPLLSLSGRAIARSPMRQSIQAILLEKSWSCICY